MLLVYPVAVYFGLQYMQPRYIGLLLLIVLTSRFLLMRRHLNRSNIHSLALVTATGSVLGILIFAFNGESGVRLTPVLINFVLLVSFLYTLYSPPSMIERLARLTDPDLPQQAINYTRKVTQVWCVFFLVNGSIAAYTCFFASLATWALYNGLIAYFLMGVLFLTEYCIRRRKIRNT